MREVPLPRDHEGREIPLDTEVMYDWRGTKVSVKKFLSRTMPNCNYSVITNFGCHYQCPYCITKQTGMHLPETDALAVSKRRRERECGRLLDCSLMR